MVVKYWFSVSDDEQERRFQARIDDPTKRWKLSPMDLQSRARWVEYSMAKDEMFAHTDIKQAPWYVVNGDDKKRARLNVIHHLLSLIPYEDLTPEPISPAAAPARQRLRPAADHRPDLRPGGLLTTAVGRGASGAAATSQGMTRRPSSVSLEPGRPLGFGRMVAIRSMASR